VSDRAEVFAVLGEVERQFGKIDGLVCAAAIQPRSHVHEMEEAAWERVLRTNLDGVVWCYQAVVAGMIARRSGSMVAFTSGLAHQGWPGASAYAASKAALIAFAKSAAKEIAPHRVRFNLIAPGVIDTPQYREANAGADDAHWRATVGVGQPEDAVGPLLFLLSDQATMTASVISRDFAFAAQER
jgi:2-hydroxycyclohexanecarboxyl-CoA dehydrogenase